MPLSFLISFIVTSHICFCGINGINTILRQMYHVKISIYPICVAIKKNFITYSSRMLVRSIFCRKSQINWKIKNI